MGWRSAVCAISLVACGESTELTPDAPVVDTICLEGGTYPMAIDAGAFPATADYPNVLVYVPAGFDRAAPVDVVVHVHGFYNCIANVIGETGTACSAGGPVRSAYSLAAQLEASGKNALLILPEVAYEQASGDPGQLGTAGGFRALLDETLAKVPIGPIDPGEVGRVIVSVHSGGYRAVAAMATIGGVAIDELWLFDALYGSTMAYDAWVMSDLTGIASTARRFANVYTSTGGTESNSQAMAERAAQWVDASVIVDDRTTATWADETYHHGLLFKASALSHDEVPRYYFERLLATSPLAARHCN